MSRLDQESLKPWATRLPTKPIGLWPQSHRVQQTLLFHLAMRLSWMSIVRNRKKTCLNYSFSMLAWVSTFVTTTFPSIIGLDLVWIFSLSFNTNDLTNRIYMEAKEPRIIIQYMTIYFINNDVKACGEIIPLNLLKPLNKQEKIAKSSIFCTILSVAVKPVSIFSRAANLHLFLNNFFVYLGIWCDCGELFLVCSRLNIFGHILKSFTQ